MQTINPAIQNILNRRERTQAAMNRADRDAILTHARLGESIAEWDGKKVIWITPKEIFARYGLDEFGRPVDTQQESN